MLTIRCPAKVNLFLEVVRKRPDAYHDLDSVFLAVSLTDTLSASLRDDDQITMDCAASGVPVDEDSLVIRAAEALRDQYGGGLSRGIHFHLEKFIPMGGGLGGGSSDAAGALWLANRLWELGLEPAELAAVGATVGSDVPFFCYGGAALCQGRGEVVHPLAADTEGLELTLVLSRIHSNTAQAYAGLTLPAEGDAVLSDACIAALEEGDSAALQHAAFNRFEPSVFAAEPGLAALHTRLEQCLDRPVRMSGSGSALWYVGTAEDAERQALEDPALAGMIHDLGVRCITVTAFPPRAAAPAPHPAHGRDRQG